MKPTYRNHIRIIAITLALPLMTHCGRNTSPKASSQAQRSSSDSVQDVYLHAYGDSCDPNGSLSVAQGQGGFIAFETNATQSTHAIGVVGQTNPLMNVSFAGATLSHSAQQNVTARVVLRDIQACTLTNAQGVDCQLSSGRAQSTYDFDIVKDISFTTRTDLSQYQDQSTLGEGQKANFATHVANGTTLGNIIGGFIGGDSNSGSQGGLLETGVGILKNLIGGSNSDDSQNVTDQGLDPYQFQQTDTRQCVGSHSQQSSFDTE